MKTELIQSVMEVRTYPYLGICNGGVVLFNAQKTGMVIKSSSCREEIFIHKVREGNFIHKVGFYTTDWLENEFTPLHSGNKVILSND